MEQIADLFHQSVQTGSSAPLLTRSLQQIKNRTEQRSCAFKVFWSLHRRPFETVKDKKHQVSYSWAR